MVNCELRACEASRAMELAVVVVESAIGATYHLLVLRTVPLADTQGFTFHHLALSSLPTVPDQARVCNTPQYTVQYMCGKQCAGATDRTSGRHTGTGHPLRDTPVPSTVGCLTGHRSATSRSIIYFAFVTYSVHTIDGEPLALDTLVISHSTWSDTGMRHCTVYVWLPVSWR